ncbi:hypothetical protein NDU88_009004 [Pleurodeles waltl]|uniref:Uncharacterized protein n=1 Tax=Pleurodeles waltl TaxID=8319 RepID=A0AAV7PW25_PLEWA|nr:hypothetical protein NDU88_009004 [Pleurodeles waltl]
MGPRHSGPAAIAQGLRNPGHKKRGTRRPPEMAPRGVQRNTEKLPIPRGLVSGTAIPHRLRRAKITVVHCWRENHYPLWFTMQAKCRLLHRWSPAKWLASTSKGESKEAACLKRAPLQACYRLTMLEKDGRRCLSWHRGLGP